MKEIKNYEGRYSATEEGRIFSHLTNKFLTPCDSGKGYLYVTLTDGKGHRQSKKIHRIIAETFLPNPNNLPCVNHKDQNTKNNNLENLEWCDYKYNNNYGTFATRISESKTNNTYNTRPVMCIETGIVYNSVKEAQETLKINNISRVCQKKPKYKTAGGYHWEYVNER